MKKLILILALLLGIFIVNLSAQSYTNNYQQQVQQKYVPLSSKIETKNITLNQIQNGWAHWGNTCAGCPSYWYQVLVSKAPIKAEDGLYYYYYYFNFFSNSYYANGKIASTYLKEVKFYYNGILAINAPYILLSPGQNIWGAWIRLHVNNVVVSFTVTNVNVY